MLRQELQAAPEPRSHVQRQEFTVLPELSVHGLRNEVPRGAVRHLRAGGSLYRRPRRVPQIAGHGGRNHLPGAGSVPEWQMRAVLRDPGSPKLHV